MFYTVARLLLSLLFKICFRLKVFGRGNFPKKGPVIVAANHASFLDPIIVGIAAPRKLNYIARNSLFKNRFFAKLLYLVNTFPVKREQGDINAFKQALNKLSQGKPLVIFPEGTRSKDGDLQKPRYGIGFIHLASGASILPCFINGSLQALPRHAKFPRPRSISVHFGRPLKFSKHFPWDKKERYLYVAEGVMRAIKELKEKAEKV